MTIDSMIECIVPWGNKMKLVILYVGVWDEIGSDFCMDLNSNTDNEFYCFVRKQPNHLEIYLL